MYLLERKDPSVDSLMNDDVIGIVGRFDKNNPKMFWVDEVHLVYLHNIDIAHKH